MTTARAVRLELRAMRRRRHPRSIFRKLYDVSDTALYVGMASGLVVEAVIKTQSSPALSVPPAPHSAASVSWMAVAVAVAAIAAFGQALLAVGPIWAGSATQAWILASPVDRRAALRPTFVRTLLLAGVAGALVAGGLTAIYPPWLVHLPWNMITGFEIGVALAGITTSAQRTVREVRRSRIFFAVLLGIAVVLGGVVALQLDVPAVSVPMDRVPLSALVLIGTGVFTGYPALSRLHRGALSVGSDLVQAAAVSTAWLDLSLISSALMVRRARRIGRVRSVRLWGSREFAFVLADLVRLRRYPATVVVWVALLPVPFFAAVSLSPVAVGPVQLLTAYAAADRLAGGLRTITGSAALRRALGGTDASLRAVHLVLPALGAVVWCLLTAAALPIAPVPTAAISAVGAVITVYAMATRPPMTYASPVFDSPFGTIPVNLIRQLVRGPALLVGLAAVQLIATH
ncbi:DUF6297 family protein [Kutzneria buriramensis]|uniref:ABC-2 type transport system permease protein n=1 Tax=Kutzneria buriramensis TaxID=1045776 RepID=A0A3E0GU62_9PSEU|nr:DUF6297 family protein [Kutzneria buriramensis]REH27100.1 hypothetical protein BCF44_13072 [Kutzneria buriramensis]